MDVAKTVKYDITHVVSSLKGVPKFQLELNCTLVKCRWSYIPIIVLQYSDDVKVGILSFIHFYFIILIILIFI